MLRWVGHRILHGRPPDPDPSVFVRAVPTPELPRASTDALTVTWIGHSTTLIQIGSVNVLTDPIFSARASPVSFAGPARWVPPGLPLDRLPPVDLIVLSHDHYDHLDVASVRTLAASMPESEWAVPHGLEQRLRPLGVRRVAAFDWWEVRRIAGLEVGCTPAQHFSGRGFRDRNTTLWCGWSFTTSVRRVFFAGDTGYHPEFARIARRFGPFDLCLMPIGAYEPRWFMRPVHMDPEEAVHALRDVGSAHGEEVPPLVPIHWGTFKLTDEPMDEPPARVQRAWHEAGLPPERLWLLAHGETRRL